MSIKRKFVIVTVIIVAIFSFGVVSYLISPKPTPPVPTPTHQSPDVETLWIDSNKERMAAGVSPLALNPELTSTATEKCADMVQNNYFSHISPSGKTALDFIKPALPNLQIAYYTGENIAEGYDTSDTTTAAWMASPGHRINILNPQFTDVGYAVCTNHSSTILVVQQFFGQQ